MAEGPNQAPLPLPGLPSCKDCLAWSEDHLAVAVGESVHILTPQPPRGTAKPISDQWHEESLPVNQFQEAEWPYQDLATLSDLAVGEEQSDSTVTSLAWSPPGLGLHRRSVLAVLTSNLILSLWESNGTPENWRRTCIVNPKINDADSGSTGFKRRSERVRAFAWLPTLHYSKASRWGMHWLLTVDDNNVITYLHVQRDNAPASEWHVKKVHQTNLWTPEQPPLGPEASHLQQLLNQSPTTKITPGLWQTLRDENGSVRLFRIQLNFRRGVTVAPQPDSPYMLEVQPTATGLEFTGRSLSPTIAAVTENTPSSADFEQAIAIPVEQFSTEFDLHGNVRVRYWGFAKDPNSSAMAACITLHPLDMIEDIPPSGENTMLVFTTSDQDSRRSQLAVADSPTLRILSWIQNHATKDNVKSAIDRNAVKVAAGAVSARFSHNEHLMEWSRSAQHLLFSSPIDGQDVSDDIQMSGAANETPSRASPSVSADSIAEACEICGSEIPMTSALSSARCAKGHYFQRCGISFLTIQEPGISKYCSRCGIQFLDLLKLKPPSGPSLLQSMFEEFDVCPSCQGKFRG